MEVDATNETALHFAQSQLLAKAVTKSLHEHGDLENSVTVVHDLIAGGVAGSAGVIVGFPLDTIKVRMQMTGSGPSLMAAQFGGVRTLFRGIGAPFATAALFNASIFCTFGASSRLWDRCVERHYGDGDSKDDIAFLKPVVCGTFTGTVTSLIIAPTEHIKLRLQTQRSVGDAAYRDSLDAARKIFVSRGLRGMYQGLYATCWRQGPAFGIYFASYEHVKELGQRIFGTESSASTRPQGGCEALHSSTWLTSIVAGGAAGSLAWAAVYPIDLIKSRIQSLPFGAPKSERSIWRLAKNVVLRDGWRALYRGLGITVLRAFPVNGIIFACYETTLMMLTDADTAMTRPQTPEMV